MHEEGPHPLLAQVPLTVSPLVSLPTATTLPYTYKSLPTSLPPSSVLDRSLPGQTSDKPRYVISPTGQAAHSDDILASCQALQFHFDNTRDDAKTQIETWEKEIQERELAEKRRVAPGWLDRNEKILHPERPTSSNQE